MLLPPRRNTFLTYCRHCRYWPSRKTLLALLVCTTVLIGCQGAGETAKASALISRVSRANAEVTTQKLLGIGEPAIRPLLRAAASNDAWLATWAENTLIDLAPNTREVLCDALSVPDPRVKLCAARLVARFPPTTVSEALTRAAADADQRVRSCVATALGEISDKRSLHTLQILMRDKKPLVRHCAAAAIAKFGASVLPQLLDGLRDADPNYRGAAVLALGHNGDRSTFGVILQALTDPSPETRTCAVEALGVLGDHQAIGPLIRSLHDKSASVRGKAALALGFYRDARITSALIAATRDPIVSVRIAVVFTLGTAKGRAALGALRRTALHDPDSYVRAQAVRSLAQCAGTDAQRHLGIFLRDTDPRVRTAAKEALRADEAEP